MSILDDIVRAVFPPDACKCPDDARCEFHGRCMRQEDRRMSEQTNEAAERSAHVERKSAMMTAIAPVTEIAPGVWRLTPVVEAEKRAAEAYAKGWSAGARKALDLAALDLDCACPSGVRDDVLRADDEHGRWYAAAKCRRCLALRAKDLRNATLPEVEGAP